MGNITSLTFSPNPPILGSNCTITAKVELKETVTNGNFTFQVAYEGAVVGTQNGDVCQNTYLPLPFESGFVVYMPPPCPQKVDTNLFLYVRVLFLFCLCFIF